MRSSISIPLVVLDGKCEVSAYTRDVSGVGVYFFVDSDEEDRIQGEFRFVMDVPPEVTLSSYCRVLCVGTAVRKERVANNLAGIAARILWYSISKGVSLQREPSHS